MSKQLPDEYVNAKEIANAFDGIREELSAACKRDKEAGMTLEAIAQKLNQQGVKTKTGKLWAYANVSQLIRNPKPPVPGPKSQAEVVREKRSRRKLGVTKTSDIALSWCAEKYPHLEQWRELASAWLRGRETGLPHAIQGVNAFLTFVGENHLSGDPSKLLSFRTELPSLYEFVWGAAKTQGAVLIHNNAHFFIEWTLTQPQFCEEDDEGRMRTSPVFRNPIPYLSRSGVARPSESVRSTLPYGYIDELRRLIASGPSFSDWKWAQDALGAPARVAASDGSAEDEDGDSTTGGEKVAPVWFQVDPSVIDKQDPDCVWRVRSRVVPNKQGRKGRGRERETIYELWSPVRWVALLVKLQLPLRTFQVRMLDSGEADTWRWQNGDWSVNQSPLAKGSEARPHSNGVFLRPNQLVDGDSKVLLHINTNKTADIGKEGNQKGYNVPWILGGPLHQDPFYWLEKLRCWQEKYNPISRLTKWQELDARHMPVKSGAQLAAYPETAFLFRTPEALDSPHLPLTITAVERPWFVALSALEKRLHARGEVMPRGGRIRLVPETGNRKSQLSTLFPLHSLRVSLITALALDGDVPLAILQKIAGHSRLVMTLYYTKPGAMQSQEAIQAGVQRLNESAGETIVDWVANTEYTQLVKDVIANSPEAFKAAVPELVESRSAAGWMVMVDGMCLVGGNNTEVEASGCHNGGPNIGAESAPKYTPVPGGARNCPRCRWFVTRPYFLPQLAARWNNAMYHCNEAKEQVVHAEEAYRSFEDERAAALSNGELYASQREYLEAQRHLEQSLKKFEDLAMNVAAITKLVERCRHALHDGGGTALIANGGAGEFEYVIEEVSSELLQLSGVCEGSELYPDLDPGKAVLRQSQLLDAALVRDNLPPAFLMLSEAEQKLVGNAFVRQLAAQMNPQNPLLGRYEVISLIDARESLRGRLGPVVGEALKLASSGRRVVPLKALPSPTGTP